MNAHQTFKEHHNRCMKKARTTEARIQSLTGTHGVVPACVRAVQIECVQAVALNGSELSWDPKEGSRQDDLQLPLNREARSTQGALPTTLRRTLMRHAGLIPAAVALDARQEQFVSRLASICAGFKPKELYNEFIACAPGGRVSVIEYRRGRRSETICCPDPGEKPAGKTTILENDTAAK